MTTSDSDLIPLADAAAQLGISEKRLIGFMARQSLYDPIGGDTPDGLMIYAWSLEPLRKRLADMTAVATSTSNAGTTDEAPAVQGEVGLTSSRETASHE